MSRFYKFLFILSMMGYGNSLPAAENPEVSARFGGGGIQHSNEMYSGNRFDAGGRAESNQMYSGNRFDEGGRAESNQMYSGNPMGVGGRAESNQIYSGNPSNINTTPASPQSRNAFDAGFYRGVQSGSAGYNAAPASPVYGYYGSTPVAPNSQVFPDDAEANALYWGEVKQMEQGR